MNAPRALMSALALGAAMLASTGAQAQLFGGDDEARRAILELRQRLEGQRMQMEQQNAEVLRRTTEENAQLRRSLLDLQGQIEGMRGEIARLRGQDEQLAREVSDLQRTQKDVAVAIEERMRKFEPARVNVDGAEFLANPEEQRAYEAALASFRRGEFAQAQNAFAGFVARYPQSGYRPLALFWMGNAQYGTRDCTGAINTFRTMLQSAQDHARAPEAVLSIANCQLELKDVPAARRTLEDLIKAYPQSEAAAAAKDRIARLPAEPRATAPAPAPAPQRR